MKTTIRIPDDLSDLDAMIDRARRQDVESHPRLRGRFRQTERVERDLARKAESRARTLQRKAARARKGEW